MTTTLAHRTVIALAASVAKSLGSNLLSTSISFEEGQAFDENAETKHLSISGPTLIRVPIEHEATSACHGDDGTATTCYYLYFAHHKGAYIRMAYAQDLRGPWTQYHPGLGDGDSADVGGGVLRRTWLNPNNAVNADEGNKIIPFSRYLGTHIASPNVHVRDGLSGNSLLHPAIRNDPDPFYVMYFHGKKVPNTGGQRSWAAVSSDGLRFYHYSEDNVGHAYVAAAEISPGNSLDGLWVCTSPDGGMTMPRSP